MIAAIEAEEPPSETATFDREFKPSRRRRR
jgi:hypothetical protein